MQLAQSGAAEASFFSNDPERIRKLEQQMPKIANDLENAREHLLGFDDEVARNNRRQAALESLQQQDDKANALNRVRKPVKSKFSDFAGETLETVFELGDEYIELKGDVLRDMLGGSVSAARSFLEKRGDVNVYDGGTGWTPMLMAVSSGNAQLVELLLEHRADLSLAAKTNGEKAIHLAVYKTSSEVLHKLLHYQRSCVQDVRNDGSTPLMVALEGSPQKVKNEFVRALLEKNADPNMKRKDGWTALGLAIRSNMRAASKLMISAQGNVLGTVPGTKPPVTYWELAANHADLQQVIRMKLSSKDLAEIEKRWPGTLLQMQMEDQTGS